MSDFADLVAKAITPSMDRAEREKVYGVVRQAVLRLQEREALPVEDPRIALQRHLVEETIRDVEADIARHEAMRKLEAALAAQTAAHAGQGGSRR
ncbi:hypothetical protein [Methylobacterium planeticum]|uniref:Uncharacterized protein n=1 Tax=Methylobacterium planeticum TaxID=2615211 RepID=A0A6N6MZY6_9HYPH|nr:hypothetical protein [Methylobacterium planeticum]KAB1076244.1 hypothetical protein F6X51_01520 [Methylobacterium planeticum]